MDINNMTMDELKEYAESLLCKMNTRQLRLAIIYLEKLLNEQEGGFEK